ncbi:hypothetical protein [Rhodococcus sp. BH5]|uniref:hypothetical protein n=1 Tax=Rhodococcus sp. BH5 TaxID=2871702 RepID=UPI0022CD7E10|nr:hypothetical protein [Rhodococcus sp. BH5]MCZ9634953.1 hypothetical protein [Rhodococcus sp. BH5]
MNHNVGRFSPSGMVGKQQIMKMVDRGTEPGGAEKKGGTIPGRGRTRPPPPPPPTTPPPGGGGVSQKPK